MINNEASKGQVVLYGLLFLFLFCASGCMTPTVKSDITEVNLENLSKLSVGMTKRQVSKVMKDKVFRLGGLYLSPTGAYFSPMWTIKNPCKVETVQGNDGKPLDVRYYVISSKSRLKEIPDEEMTPLVFEDEKLIGWGWEFLQAHIKK